MSIVKFIFIFLLIVCLLGFTLLLFAVGRGQKYEDAYIKGYNKCLGEVGNVKTKVSVKTLDALLLSSKGNICFFFIFAGLDLLVLIGAELYLIFRENVLKIQIGKILVAVAATCIWLRFVQDVLFVPFIPGYNAPGSGQLIIEGIVFIGSILLCWFFRRFFIEFLKDHDYAQWLDSIGIFFITLLILQLTHYTLNWSLLLKLHNPQFAIYIFGAFCLGGIFYTIYYLFENDGDRQSFSDFFSKLFPEQSNDHKKK